MVMGLRSPEGQDRNQAPLKIPLTKRILTATKLPITRMIGYVFIGINPPAVVIIGMMEIEPCYLIQEVMDRTINSYRIFKNRFTPRTDSITLIYPIVALRVQAFIRSVSFINVVCELFLVRELFDIFSVTERATHDPPEDVEVIGDLASDIFLIGHMFAEKEGNFVQNRTEGHQPPYR